MKPFVLWLAVLVSCVGCHPAVERGGGGAPDSHGPQVQPWGAPGNYGGTGDGGGGGGGGSM